MTQREQVLAYIREYGSITPLDAFRDLGCTRLAARINDLEKEGYTFNRKYETKPNRYGKKVTYMRYSL